MNNDHQQNSILWIVVAVVLALAGIACLTINNTWFPWLIVSIGILYGLRLTWKYGRIWWRGKHNRVAQRERFLLFLVSLMTLFLATGTALHLWALICEEGDFINAEYLFRSLVCSLQLFAASIDSNIVDGVRNHPYIKGLISVQAVLSFMCTIAIILSLAFARVKAYYRLHWKTKVNTVHNHLYVFWGINEPSRLLAKSIRDNDSKAILLFVENSHSDEEEHGGLESVVSMFTHRRQTYSDVDELGAKVTFTETRLCDIHDSIGKEQSAWDIFSIINLKKLRNLILDLQSWPDDAQLHFLFLSDNEEENIRSASILSFDSTIESINNQNVTLRFYCRARKNELNSVIEDIALKRVLDFRIVDPSHLSIELLKANKEHHPVRLVDISTDNPTTVKSDFNALIVGFNEVGMDAFRFLYEFGAFVDYDATPQNDYRSPFHCVITDKRMEELKGALTTFAPAPFQQKNRDGSNLVELRDDDYISEEFFKEVINEKLNYVIIALDDDDAGMTLAVRILNYIRMKREDLSDLRIYVRSNHTDKETYLQKIAEHYNDSYNNCCKDEYKTDAIIRLFGQKHLIYSFDMVVNEELTQKARIFHGNYIQLKDVVEKDKVLWEERKRIALKANTLDSIRRLRRNEQQNLTNALYIGTNIYLLKHAMPNTDWEDFWRRYFDGIYPKREGHYDTINYPSLSYFENKVILNLARLEHIRWIASHELLGYTRAPENEHSCNERTRQHNCLCPWQELDNEGKLITQTERWNCDYKSYDFGVVDISILLSKGELLSNEQE